MFVQFEFNLDIFFLIRVQSFCNLDLNPFLMLAPPWLDFFLFFIEQRDKLLGHLNFLVLNRFPINPSFQINWFHHFRACGVTALLEHSRVGISYCINTKLINLWDWVLQFSPVHYLCWYIQTKLKVIFYTFHSYRIKKVN